MHGGYHIIFLSQAIIKITMRQKNWYRLFFLFRILIQFLIRIVAHVIFSPTDVCHHHRGDCDCVWCMRACSFFCCFFSSSLSFSLCVDELCSPITNIFSAIKLCNLNTSPVAYIYMCKISAHKNICGIFIYLCLLFPYGRLCYCVRL